MVIVTNEKHSSLVTLSLPIYISLLKYICSNNIKLIISFCIVFISLYNPKKKIITISIFVRIPDAVIYLCTNIQKLTRSHKIMS